MRVSITRLVSALAFVLAFALEPGRAHAVVYPCTLAGLDAALAAGGIATFSCTGPTTIVVPATRTIAQSGTQLDGESRLVISGGDAHTPLVVAAGVSATIRGVTIERGYADAFGGCLRVEGTLDLERSTLRQCRSSSGGDVVFVTATGQLRASASTLIGAGDGGAEGAVGARGVAELTNVTIDSPFRGVVARAGGRATLAHCTITSASTALFPFDAGDTITIGHSLIASPTPAAEGAGTLVSQGHNLFQVAPVLAPTGSLTGNQVATPLLGPLADNGGPSPTRALLACSPGINAGATTGGPASDQRGEPRVAGGARDIGAFESTLLPCIGITDASVFERDSGSVTATLTVTLSGTSSIEASAEYWTQDDTARVADSDYVVIPFGELTFPPGTTTRTITVTVLGDTRHEPDERFFVTLVGLIGASYGDGQAQVRIVNDDPAPVISVSDVSVTEGDGGTTPARFTVTLSGPSASMVRVSYATQVGSATSTDDYVTTSGTLTFPAGTTSLDVDVDVRGDLVHEPDEAFALLLSSPSGGTLGDSVGVATIVNDDAPPTISIGDASIVEGTTGTNTLTFLVTLSHPSSSPIDVSYATADGTATVADSDYDEATGTQRIPAGQTWRSIGVTVRGDTRPEPDETFALRLSEPSIGTLGDAEGVGTIENDDALPTIAIDDLAVVETDAALDTAITVRLTGTATGPVTVAYATADDTATSGADYDAASGTLTFAPGVATQTIPLRVLGDDLHEGVERFTVALSAPTGATLADASADVTITDDDVAPDAGTDAGEPLDASVPAADAGAADAGTADASTADAGTPDAGVGAPADGGCGCVVIGGDRRAASPIAAAIMLALALVIAARRRTR